MPRNAIPRCANPTCRRPLPLNRPTGGRQRFCANAGRCRGQWRTAQAAATRPTSGRCRNCGETFALVGNGRPRYFCNNAGKCYRALLARQRAGVRSIRLALETNDRMRFPRSSWRITARGDVRQVA